MQECKVCEWNAEYVLLSVLDEVRGISGYYCRDCAFNAILNSFQEGIYFEIDTSINLEEGE